MDRPKVWDEVDTASGCTVDDLAEALQNAEMAANGGGRALYPLTFEQERLFLREELAPETLVVRQVAPLPGHPSAERVAAALERVVATRDALRMQVAIHDGATSQLVRDERGIEEIPADANPTAYGAHESWSKVASPPLFFSLDRSVDPAVFTLFLDHGFVDGWAANLVVADLARHLEVPRGRRPEEFGQGPSFAEYARRQRRAASPARIAEHMAFWVEELSGAAPLPLPFTKEPWEPGLRHGRFPTLFFEMKGYSTGDVKVAFGSDAVAMLAALAGALHACTGATDLLLNSGFADRGSVAKRSLVGCLVNRVTLRLRLTGTDPEAVLAAAQDAIRRAARHQIGPFQLVARTAPAGRILSLTPRVTVLFHGALPCEVPVGWRWRDSVSDYGSSTASEEYEHCFIWESFAESSNDLEIAFENGPPTMPVTFRITYCPQFWDRRGIQMLGEEIVGALARLVAFIER